ncbi:MAG: hypothetical protein IJD76_05360 [Bacilli bacterium]|nr:hypothetical protein [Bacilli bacterium]
MIKKNQFALVFLTLVTMLAVWYVKTPTQAEKEDTNVPVVDVIETGRLNELAKMREELINERNDQMSVWNEVIASGDASAQEKDNALKEKEKLSSLTELETLFELEVINLGYRDSFVEVNEYGVEILVVAEEDSYTSANEIVLMAFNYFSEDYGDVVVTFKDASNIVNS